MFIFYPFKKKKVLGFEACELLTQMFYLISIPTETSNSGMFLFTGKTRTKEKTFAKIRFWQHKYENRIEKENLRRENKITL